MTGAPYGYQSKTEPCLRVASSGVLIVAHNENTGPLRNALFDEGFSVEEVKGPYTPEQLSYSAIIRALVNHSNAWRIAAERSLPTIVVEADFVPVRGFGDLPVPLASANDESGIGYLYAVGPQIWDLAAPHVARGHGGGAVALLIPPRVAATLLEFFEEEIKLNSDGKYRPWDAGMGYWLLKRGVESYLPYRHYGEHGGIANYEHAQFGFGRQHRADVLHGSLAFRPMYSEGSPVKLWSTRLGARSWGALRLMCGRFLTTHDFRRSEERVALLRFALGRVFLRNCSAERKRDCEAVESKSLTN